MEVKGNFYGGNKKSFNPTGTHKVKLSGTNKQEIQCSNFNSVQFANTSQYGVSVSEPLKVFGELKVSDSNVKVFNTDNIQLCKKAVIVGEWPGSITVSEDWQMQSDQIIAGNLKLSTGTIDANGKSLYVKGNLNQFGGTLYIDGGSVHIGGSYTKYPLEDPYLKMDNEKDYLLIDGSFYTNSSNNDTGYLTAGVMEVKGDFYGGNIKSFNPTGTHKVKLSGTNRQEIRCSYFNSVEFANTSQAGVSVSAPLKVYGELKVSDSNVKVFGTYSIQLCKKAVIVGEWPGSITVSEDWQMQSDQIIAGNLTLSAGTIDANGKSLYVKGDLNQYGRIRCQ